MKTLTIDDKDYARAVKLLLENGINAEIGADIPLLHKSDAQPGETPATFSGIWANDERTMASIRAKAWPKRN